MTKIEKFEDMIAWQKTRLLAKDCYAVFRMVKDYSFRDQIQRAVVSIMNNIAEGFERKGNKEFLKFLYIAKGSCAETKSMLYLSLDLGYIKQGEFDRLMEQSKEIARLIQGLIRSL